MFLILLKFWVKLSSFVLLDNFIQVYDDKINCWNRLSRNINHYNKSEIVNYCKASNTKLFHRQVILIKTSMALFMDLQV